MNKLLIIAIFGAFTACSQTAADKPNGSDFSTGQKIKRLKNDRIKEASGIAASIRNAGMLWTHNDSGNDAELFLLDTALNVKLNVKFSNLTNRDWEDIAVGPGPDPAKSYVYIGEIGDNFAQYQEKRIYRFEEPAIGQNITMSIDSVDVIKIQLPKARKDTEALMIDSNTRDLYIVSKRENPVVVYKVKYPYPVDSIVTADSVTTNLWR